MTLVFTIVGGVVVAAIAAVLAHRLTSRRDQANRRSALRVEYLLGAYRVVADVAHRDLDPTADYVRAFEQALSDIQLLGSRVQAEMVIAISRQLATAGSADLSNLLVSLRDDLREELELEPVGQAPFHVRIAGDDESADDSEAKASSSGSGETSTDEPMPDVAAAVRRSRESH
jgi:hypothetical protein